jgi:hypothetical protein
MFNLFKKKPRKQKSFRDVVYDFAAFLSDHSSPIKDERLLPFPKEEIVQSFLYYKIQLKGLSQFDKNAADELREVELVEIRVHDFQKIDPEDYSIVSEINTGDRFKSFRGKPDADSNLSEQQRKNFIIYMQYAVKYMNRSLNE